MSENRDELTFPYSVDERDASRLPRKLGKGMTEYVLNNGAALLANTDDITHMRESGDVIQSGHDSVCWLGVPLVCAERTVGVLVVQSYAPEHRYSLRDQELLTFVSYHIANALERVRAAESLKQAYTGLERRVGERTRALALANRDLSEQIAERERVEARLKYETLHDSLTGLPNRSLLTQRLEQAMERYQADPSQAVRRAVPRPRPLQGDQRFGRPPDRRRPAVPGRRPGSRMPEVAGRGGPARRR